MDLVKHKKMVELIEKIDREVMAEKKKLKRKKQKPLVKRPLGAYQFFVKELASNCLSNKKAFSMKEASEKWKTLLDKSKYEKMREDDIVRYNRECEEKGVVPFSKKKKNE